MGKENAEGEKVDIYERIEGTEEKRRGKYFNLKNREP
jgi:hypothetical protein